MTTLTTPNIAETVNAQPDVRPVHGLWFDWLLAGLGTWTISGLYLDGWAHFHDQVDDTFFTPWHAALYSGVAVLTITLAAFQLGHMARGQAWRRALPRGYGLSLVGALMFLAGGGLDMAWHTLFGFEADVEALLSPAHLWLAAGGLLMVTGPLRAAWRSSNAPAGNWLSLGPAVWSAANVLSIATFFTNFAHPVVNTFTVFSARSDWRGQSLGLAGILLQSVVLAALSLMLVTRWKLPVGTLSLILGVNTALMSVLTDEYRLIPAGLLAGVIADALVWRWSPSLQRPRAWQAFAFAVPAAFSALYFLTLKITSGLGWSIHLWAGAILLSGLVGWSLSWLIMAPLQQAMIDDK
jgi:hypothetical protein